MNFGGISQDDNFTYYKDVGKSLFYSNSNLNLLAIQEPHDSLNAKPLKVILTPEKNLRLLVKQTLSIDTPPLEELLLANGSTEKFWCKVHDKFFVGYMMDMDGPKVFLGAFDWNPEGYQGVYFSENSGQRGIFVLKRNSLPLPPVYDERLQDVNAHKFYAFMNMMSDSDVFSSFSIADPKKMLFQWATISTSMTDDNSPVTTQRDTHVQSENWFRSAAKMSQVLDQAGTVSYKNERISDDFVWIGGPIATQTNKGWVYVLSDVTYNLNPSTNNAVLNFSKTLNFFSYTVYIYQIRGRQ
jgi:hypothetical protein